MKELYQVLGIKGNLSTAYRPQTNGQMERLNQESERYLQTCINFQQDDWAEWLSVAEFTYDNAAHSATGETSF
jgi:transposase InsO family protein